MVGIGIGIPFLRIGGGGVVSPFQWGTATGGVVSPFQWGTATAQNWGTSTSQTWG